LEALDLKAPMNQSKLETLRNKFKDRFQSAAEYVYSAPGRTELGGNHTDHNNGKVLAASVDLDMTAAVAARTDHVVRVFSEGLGTSTEIAITDSSVRKEERGTTAALIRGMAAAFDQWGYGQGGFDAYVESRVGVGSGLSSSACFEVLMGTIMNDLTAEGKIGATEIALAGQRTENDYFGKPCGLMDQLTCAIGGALKIDFRDPGSPVVQKIDFDPRIYGFGLVVVNTGSDHADLTDEYASIPAEMRSVARFFGVETCRDIDEQVFVGAMKEVRKACGDRAALRCLHFLEENKRVDREFDALQKNDFGTFLKVVQESGDSSMKWLQNIYPGADPEHQSVTLALALADRFLASAGKGAYRVHGGGFAGTIQAYVPLESLDDFVKTISGIFGPSSVSPLAIRPTGAVRVA